MVSVCIQDKRGDCIDDDGLLVGEQDKRGGSI